MPVPRPAAGHSLQAGSPGSSCAHRRVVAAPALTEVVTCGQRGITENGVCGLILRHASDDRQALA